VESVPGDSYASPWAQLLAGAASLEQGDREKGRRALESLLADPLPLPERREAALRLAGLAMEESRYEDAYALYRSADADWTAARAELGSREDSAGAAAIWDAWEADGFWPESLPLVPSFPEREEAALHIALDLTREDVPYPGPLDGRAPRTVTLLARLVPPPASRILEPVHEAGRLAESAEATRLASERRLDLALRDAARRRSYLEHGAARTELVRGETPPVAARLATLAAGLDSLQTKMERIKNAALDRFVRRARSLQATAAAQDLAARAMQRHHARGPRPRALPDSLLTAEDTLAAGVQSFANAWGAAAPGLLNASFAQNWSPGLAARIAELRALASRVTGRGDSLALALTITTRGLDTSPEILALQNTLTHDTQRADSLATLHLRLRDEVARSELAQALTQLQTDREPVDLGLALAAYEVSLAGTSGTSEPDSLGHAEQARTEAGRRLEAFLAAYPASPARADVRYRLADVRLTDARLRFEGAMAARLARGEAETGGLDLPIFDVTPALSLYRSILAEDPGYGHRDAVLFNLGMALLEQGEREGTVHLAELLREFPDSPYRQEVTLRLGDVAFEDLDHAAAIPLYEQSAEGSDPNLSAIALYRLGWCHYREDRFAESAIAFRRLLDLSLAHREPPLKTDLQDEAMENFIQVLARGGGARLFATLFDTIDSRPYERKTLQGVAGLYREYSLYAEAIEADRLFLERYPEDAACLTSAERLSTSYELSKRPDQARAARLEVAERFTPGSAWNRAATDSLRGAAETFARGAYLEAALFHHQRARAEKDPAEWRQAGDLYEAVLRYWPSDPEIGKVHLFAGEAASGLDDFSVAREHFERASALLPASADSLITQADWELVALSDRWYRSTLPAAGGRDALGSDSLAALVRTMSSSFVKRHPGDNRGAGALWRSGNLAFAHAWYADAAADWETLLDRYPRDPRAPEAAALRGDAWFRSREYERARDAYESALTLAHSAGRDSLAARIEQVLPLAAHRHAESVAEKDEARAAPLFAALASRWPKFEHADLAWYRAGLGYAKGGDHESAIAAWTKLLDPPSGEYARDARLRIAGSYESRKLWGQAAESYRALSEAYPDHEEAPAAWLKAADLWDLAADSTRAASQRLAYVDRYPEDVAGGMAILEELAESELRRAGDTPISKLTHASKKPGPLARYLTMAKAHPDLASPALQARVQFLAGEEAMSSYRALRLTLPLDRSVLAKKRALDRVLKSYGKVAGYGVGEWARAATYRIGEALLGFGDALLASERPPGLAGDDLAAYDEVLQEQAWTFTDRGEDVWSGLLLETREVTEDTGGWIAKTRTSYWPLLAHRFYAMPEVEHPLVAGTAPEPGESMAVTVKPEVHPAGGATRHDAGGDR
jgi:TolA-binding protein